MISQFFKTFQEYFDFQNQKSKINELEKKYHELDKKQALTERDIQDYKMRIFKLEDRVNQVSAEATKASSALETIKRIALRTKQGKHA